MADEAIGLTYHFHHAGLKQASGVFEALLVELRGNLHRLAEQLDAAPERQGEMKAIPSRQHAPAARSEG